MCYLSDTKLFDNANIHVFYNIQKKISFVYCKIYTQSFPHHLRIAVFLPLQLCDYLFFNAKVVGWSSLSLMDSTLSTRVGKSQRGTLLASSSHHPRLWAVEMRCRGLGRAVRWREELRGRIELIQIVDGLGWIGDWDDNGPKDAEPQLLWSACFVDRIPHMECGVGLGESTLGP